MANEGYHETRPGSGVYTPNAGYTPPAFSARGTSGQGVLLSNTTIVNVAGREYGFNTSTGQQISGGALPAGYAYNPIAQTVEPGAPLPQLKPTPEGVPAQGARYYSKQTNETTVGLGNGEYAKYKGNYSQGQLPQDTNKLQTTQLALGSKQNIESKTQVVGYLTEGKTKEGLPYSQYTPASSKVFTSSVFQGFPERSNAPVGYTESYLATQNAGALSTPFKQEEINAGFNAQHEIDVYRRQNPLTSSLPGLSTPQAYNEPETLTFYRKLTAYTVGPIDTAVVGSAGILTKAYYGKVNTAQQEVFNPQVTNLGILAAGTLVFGGLGIAAQRIGFQPSTKLLLAGTATLTGGSEAITQAPAALTRSIRPSTYFSGVAGAATGGLALGYGAIKYSEFKTNLMKPRLTGGFEPELVLTKGKVGYRVTDTRGSVLSEQGLRTTASTRVLSEQQLLKLAGTNTVDEAFGALAQKGFKVNPEAIGSINGFIEQTPATIKIGGRTFKTSVGGDIEASFIGAKGGHQYFTGQVKTGKNILGLEVSENIKPLATDASKTAFNYLGKLDGERISGGGITTYGKTFTTKEALTKAFDFGTYGKNEFVGYTPRAIKSFQSQLVYSMTSEGTRFNVVTPPNLRPNARVTLDIKSNAQAARITNLIENDLIRLPEGYARKGTPFTQETTSGGGVGNAFSGGLKTMGVVKQKAVAYVSPMKASLTDALTQTAKTQYARITRIETITKAFSVTTPRATTITRTQPLTIPKTSAFTQPQTTTMPKTQTLPVTRALTQTTTIPKMQPLTLPKTFTTSIPRTITQPLTIPVTQQIIIPKITTVTQTRQTPFTGYNPIYTPTPPIPITPVFPPIGGLGGPGDFLAFPTRGFRARKTRKRYTPDITSVIFNVRGKKPKTSRYGFSGLEPRPII